MFLYASAKSKRENIAPTELSTLREIAATWLAADAEAIEKALAEGILQEVTDGR